MHNFINTAKAFELGNPFWEKTSTSGLLNIAVEYKDNGHLTTKSGFDFINLCSYSYLGLDGHPKIVNGAITALMNAKTVNTPIARIRVHLNLLEEAELALTKLFKSEAIVTLSCAAASAGILPLLASGLLTNGKNPTIIFDKHAHFSLNHNKPICNDETLVLTAPHNDLNYIEDICKKYETSAYIADSIYSSGGVAPIKELIYLQNKYGLFLLFDEAHSISVYGENGTGLILKHMSALNDRTIIISSLNKGFGAVGGLILLGSNKHKTIIDRFGGPIGWSQHINVAGLGAILASVEIHKTKELAERQFKLKENIAYFDKLLKTENAINDLPIRFIPVTEESKAVSISERIFQQGYYTSPWFFPIIPRGKAGLRLLLRADLTSDEIFNFHKVVKKELQ